MLLTIHSRCGNIDALDYDLVDLLRAISRYDHRAVIGTIWRISDVDAWPYTPRGDQDQVELSATFPDMASANMTTALIVRGERMMEKSALIHQFESGLFLRLIDRNQSAIIVDRYRLSSGPSHFQATNIDLEIRCDEALQYEIVSEDMVLLEYLQSQFVRTTFTP